MTTIKLSAVALLLTSTFAFAGGDIEEIEPVIETPEVIAEETPSTGNFYAGLAYSCLHLTTDTPDTKTTAWTGASISVGYNFNQYLAVEGRYTTRLGDVTYETYNVDEDKDWDMSNIGIYLKPKYTMNKFGVYGLLGYGQTSLDNGTSYSADGIQYGAGLSLDATDNVQVFIDYRRLYDDSDFDGYAVDRDVATNSWSLGINYNF